MEHTREARDRLKAKVIRAFARRDEIHRIDLFGREVAGKADQYSDIDLIVSSSKPAKTHAEYRDVFTSIAPIRASFLLESTADEFAEMVLLEESSPYHKIDFSIVSNIDEAKPWAAPFVTVYRDDREGNCQPISRLPVTPINKTAAYVSYDMLLSIPRFTKCLFRRDQDMYRRWERCTRTLLNLLYEKHFGWTIETAETALRIPRRKALFAAVDKDEHERLTRIFPPNDELNLADSYRASIEILIILAQQKATQFDEAIDLGFVEYMQTFLLEEIERFQASHNSPNED